MSDKEKKREPEKEVLGVLGFMIHDQCKKYALDHMLSGDFILLSDANFKPTEDIRMRKGDNGDLYTIKNSSRAKFTDFYGKKLNDIIKNFLKENA